MRNAIQLLFIFHEVEFESNGSCDAKNEIRNFQKKHDSVSRQTREDGKKVQNENVSSTHTHNTFNQF